MTKNRKQYFVKPRLQIKYLLLLAFIVLASAILIYYIFLDSLLSSPGMEQLSAGAIKNFVTSYTSNFFWITIFFMIFVLVESVFYFHRIVGPIFFFEKLTKKLSEGDFTVQSHYRKKDETKELAQNINNVITNVKIAVSDDRKKIEEIKIAIDNGKIDEAKHKLSELTQWFKIVK